MKQLILLTVLLAFTAVWQTADAQRMTEDEEKAWAEQIVGPEDTDDECAACHTLEHEAWTFSRHYITYKEQHRSPEAKEILANLGESSMKRISSCRQCHYTSVVDDGDVEPEWGVSCESCHGPAANWLEVHNVLGGDTNADTMEWGDGRSEPAESHAARLNAAADRGMLHPERLYDVASNCFDCHTVPDESLVNVGGHHAGKSFDLVARSQGEVRHNFLSSDDDSNAESSPEELRRLYVVGAAVDLEYSLRNLANVKERGGDFHKAQVERVNSARDKLAAANSAAAIPGIAAVLADVPGSVDESTTVDAGIADRLQEATRAFVENNDGSQLAGLDGLIPTEYDGEAYEW